MNNLLCSLLVCLLSLGKPTEPTESLKEFMRALVASKLSNAEIGERFFCTAVLHRTDQYGAKARAGLEYSLTLQRDYLRTQQMNLSEVTFTAYAALPATAVPPKPFHMLGETTHVYVAQYHGEIVLYALLQDNQIASILLLGQGDEHYFINFCH
jgi:hypothetical protein